MKNETKTQPEWAAEMQDEVRMKLDAAAARLEGIRPYPRPGEAGREEADVIYGKWRDLLDIVELLGKVTA